MILSLRTTSYTAAVVVALLLGFLLLLGSRQYRSHKEYKNIIEQNEKIIFQFATIREHITESLLENRPQQLNNITNEIEKLNLNISHILQQPIIPDQYRISFAGQVDFAGIILLLRNIGAGDQTQAKVRQLNQEMRILGERLMLFDRVIVDHVKRKLVGFQNFVIGLLAVILFIVIYILLFWHSQIAMPLLDLIKQAKEASTGKRSAIAVRKKSGEVAELAGSFQNLLARQNRTSSEIAQYNRVLDMVHSMSESVRQASSRDAVFAEACRIVLSNTDYVLVWIGTPGKDNRIEPVIVDGSTTMSRQEQDECMAALLAAAKENRDRRDGAGKALEQRSPVILRNVSAGLPNGPFKNTPFADSQVDCIALPLVNDQQIFGVMNIYSNASRSYTDEEIELLQNMCREIVFAVFTLAAKESNRSLRRLQAARKIIFENNSDLIMVMNRDGTIIEANPAAEEKLRTGSDTIIGANMYELFQSDLPAPRQFPDFFTAENGNMSSEIKIAGTEYTVSIAPLKQEAEQDETYLLIARDISEQENHRIETVRASKLAALGELSVGVANEINNLTNGLINYTQILSEEISENAGNNKESIALLENVIREGEKISQIVQRLIYFNANHSQTKEAVKINKILEDSLALTKNQFGYDAIEVAVSLPDILPSVKVNVQEMQHIFLNLLSNARYALNQRYPGQHAQKRIEIEGEITALNGNQRLKVICTDFGIGIQPNIISRVFEPFFSTKPEGIGTGLGLSICRGILEDYNGTLEIESTLDDHTSLIMELPVAA